MKKCFAMLLALMILLSCSVSALAADGNVVYNGNSKKFIFTPGSEYSPTDLFPNFKDVMPGDRLEQRIMLKNDVSNKCKVDVFMRVLGAQPGSEEFLSQLHLNIIQNTDTLLFNAPADQGGQLAEWQYIGTLYSGGECELLVVLDVPVTLDNNFKNLVGELDWEFAVRELPVSPEDPKVPQTGDNSNPLLWAAMLGGSVAALFLLIIIIRKKKERE